MEGLCGLHIDEITFPGTHNAGSGFHGVLHYWNGVVALSCFYRNQEKNFYDQLDAGIRFFDIDTCLWKNDQIEPCHCGGGSCAYAGNIDIALTEIDNYMKTHPNEVIIIHFNRDVDGGEEAKKKIAEGLAVKLESRWHPDGGGQVLMSTHARWPTLRKAIETKQRIFLFMENGLAKYLDKPWVYESNSLIRQTWESVYVGPGGCGGIVDPAKEKCGTTRDFVELMVFGTHGLCIWDMAWHCSRSMASAVDECYKKRQNYGLTVNIILVDYAVSNYDGDKSVMNQARIMNEKNIQRFKQESPVNYKNEPC